MNRVDVNSLPLSDRIAAGLPCRRNMVSRILMTHWLALDGLA